VTKLIGRATHHQAAVQNVRWTYSLRGAWEMLGTAEFVRTHLRHGREMEIVVKNSALTLTLIGFATTAGAREARAMPLPDNSSCNAGVCLDITNSTSGGNAVVGNSASGAGIFGATVSGSGVVGDSISGGTGVMGTSSSGTAVYGYTSSGTAVYGRSVSAIGVWGLSGNSNGVVGQNYNTDWSGAAVVAWTGGDSALAFWGQGDIILTGNYAQKAGGGSWSAPSDARIKKDIKDFKFGLDSLMRIRPVTYRYNGLGGSVADGEEYVGVIAQELEKVLPFMVRSYPGKLHETDTEKTDIKHVDPSAFTYVLINAVQAQQKTMEEQQAIIQDQETRIQRLEKAQPLMQSSLLPSRGLDVALIAVCVGLGLVQVVQRKRERKS
jgi:hypothetical protein